jgi:hypothetical protein
MQFPKQELLEPDMQPQNEKLNLAKSKAPADAGAFQINNRKTNLDL